MNQLRLAYSSSNPKTPNYELPSKKLRMSRAGLSKLPRLASKMIQLQSRDPRAAAVIEKLVDHALAASPLIQGIPLE